MSGKFSKKAKKASSRKRKSGSGFWIGLCAFLVLLGLSVILLLALTSDEDTSQPQETTPTFAQTDTENPAAETTDPAVRIDEIIEADMNMENGLEIVNIGKYTGLYMEDGSDEILSGILMIVVTNTNEETIQYAKIILTAATGETAEFTLSTLPGGESIVLLEQNRQEYRDDLEFVRADTVNLALFSEPVSLQEDSLKIQAYEGALNITNISGQDITGDIVIYYKNSSSDMLYGGITYRVRIEGGLKADELRQLMPSHFSAEGSRIMFITIG